MNAYTDQHGHSLLKKLEALFWNRCDIGVFRALVALFLDCKLRTTLQNIRSLSASTASRFLSCEHVPDEVYWAALNRWQLEQCYLLPRRGRRGDVVLKLDLTCIEKTGKQIPFARLFNRCYGIQLVMLHACVGGLSFPLGYRVYLGKGQSTPVDLALELLEQFPASQWASRTVVLADAGFGSAEFICGCQQLGFTRLLVGIRCNRKLSDGRHIEQLSKRGEQVALHDLNNVPLWLSWCDIKREAGKTRFYVAATFSASGAYLAQRYRRRWLIEAFFDSIKHDFGLKEARLRTKTGIRMWIFLACLAYSFARLARHLSQQTITLLEAAQDVLDTLLDVRLLHLMIDCERFSQTSPRPLKLVAV